jgi:hypothetical protein
VKATLRMPQHAQRSSENVRQTCGFLEYSVVALASSGGRTIPENRPAQNVGWGRLKNKVVVGSGLDGFESLIDFHVVYHASSLHSPITQSNEHCRQGEDLPNFYADVETDNVCNQATPRQRQFLKLSHQTETVEQRKNEHRDLGMGSKPKKRWNPPMLTKPL